MEEWKERGELQKREEGEEKETHCGEDEDGWWRWEWSGGWMGFM